MTQTQRNHRRFCNANTKHAGNASYNHADNTAANPACWQAGFLAMLPKIQSYASLHFRELKGDNRDEAIQSAICHACVAYARLVERGCSEVATWTTLARYGIHRVRAGRAVGSRINVRDVTSRHCQLRKGARVQSMHRWDNTNEEWSELVVEDRHSTPADLAAFRVDFRSWLKTLSRQKRRITLRLCRGESTQTVARLFRLSAGRISQIRKELCEAWREFQGETAVVMQGR